MFGLLTRATIYLGVVGTAIGAVELWRCLDPPRPVVAQVKTAPQVAFIERVPVPAPRYVNQVYEIAIRATFGPCGDPCRVRINLGGEVASYALAAWALVNGARSGLVIDGPCASACAMAADFAHAVTCITPRARFWFHLSNDGYEPPQRKEIAAYVRANGGFPPFESGELTPMEYETALQFWKPCR